MSTPATLAEIGIGQALLGPYRPPNWGSRPQRYWMSCTLPAATVSTSASVNGQVSPGSVGQSTQPAQTTIYYFDAVLRAEHVQEAVGTKHPVQVGPAVVDHIYLNPNRIMLEVLMSDSSVPFLIGQYSSGGSKSVSAYQAFKQIQASRVPITLSTRLETVANMWLSDVRALEDYRTFAASRIMLHFEQQQNAMISTATAQSQRPNATNTTNEGTKQPTVPPPPDTTNLPLGAQ